MKYTIFALATMLAGTTAQADGFLCKTDDGLDVKVFNHTLAEQGTRSVAKMIVSDDNIAYGNKTIATFSDAQAVLSSHRQTYIANVDLRFKESNRSGERISGTRLGALSRIILSVDFSYANPLDNDATVNGTLTTVKRNGEEHLEGVNCKRYLKSVMIEAG